MRNKKESQKKICEYSGCDNPVALTLLDDKGHYNFIPHIINGEQKTVCLNCKMKLLKKERV